MTVYINTTPHALNFVNPDGEEFVVEKSRWLLNAAVEEKIVRSENGIQFVETVFRPSEEGWKMIAEIRAEHGANCVIIGSLIAAQAYKGAVVAMVAAPGFERVPPAEKKMNAKKFTIFPAQTAPENKENLDV